MSWSDFLRLFQNYPKKIIEREFQFKFLHRIVVTKKELCRYGIKSYSDCSYYGELDSIEHTFIDCQFTKSFVAKARTGLISLMALNFIPR